MNIKRFAPSLFWATAVVLVARAEIASPVYSQQQRQAPTSSLGTLTGRVVDEFELSEASIAEARNAMASGDLSSVELTVMYLNRIAAYDANGLSLNSIPVRNPDVLLQAAAADAARAAGDTRSLLGIPYTVKDSFRFNGMTVSSGSPAFQHLVSRTDAFMVSAIRDAGGVLIGKTNMPPLASGGMQKGVYGRAESPYNPAYLTAAYSSGSSNGSGTSTGASFAMFGIGEETVSSGRSPASNNGLVAYTGSRGMLSTRGNFPLFPLRDVVTPHTRTVTDMLDLLNVIMVDDVDRVGDLWREQQVVALPPVEQIRPDDLRVLAEPGALRGKRIGVPRMYINKDPNSSNPIVVRPSIITLWEQAAKDLVALGAEVIEVDFPVMENAEGTHPTSVSPMARGIIPRGWFDDNEQGIRYEGAYVNTWYSEWFVQTTGDSNITSFAQVPPELVFPLEPGSPEEVRGASRTPRFVTFRDQILNDLMPPWELESWPGLLNGLEEWRRVDFENWMDSLNLDLVVFPANADVGLATANREMEAQADATRNGVYFSNMNGTMRWLGIPSMTVSMGIMPDIRMPVGLTFIGKAYSDFDLLRYAYDYEQASQHRVAPPSIAPLHGEVVTYNASTAIPPQNRSETVIPVLSLEASAAAPWELRIAGTASDTSGISETRVYVNGQVVDLPANERWSVTARIPFGIRHVDVIAMSKDALGNTAAQMKSFVVSHEGVMRERGRMEPVMVQY